MNNELLADNAIVELHAGVALKVEADGDRSTVQSNPGVADGFEIAEGVLAVYEAGGVLGVDLDVVFDAEISGDVEVFGDDVPDERSIGDGSCEFGDGFGAGDPVEDRLHINDRGNGAFLACVQIHSGIHHTVCLIHSFVTRRPPRRKFRIYRIQYLF